MTKKNVFIKWTLPIILALFSIGLFLPVTLEWLKPINSDSSWHILQANELAAKSYIDSYIPHIFFQQVVVVVRALIPFQYIRFLNLPSGIFLSDNSIIVSAVVVIALAYALLMLLIYRRVVTENPDWKPSRLATVASLTAIGLSIIAPITWFTLPSQYFGYIPLTVYLIPTMTLLKPISLILFWLVIDRLAGKNAGSNFILLAAILTIINSMTKPNFIMCFVPVLFLWFIYQIIKKNRLDWKFFLFGLFIPASFILIIQFIITFLSSSVSGIAFAPFQLIFSWMPSIGQIILRLLFSIAFPLITLALFFKPICRQPRLVIAYFSFLLGLSFFYLFAEKGQHFLAGNFVWGAQITLFILFVELTLFLIRYFKELPESENKTMRYIIVSSFWLCHVFSGIVWYVSQFLKISIW